MPTEDDPIQKFLQQPHAADSESFGEELIHDYPVQRTSFRNWIKAFLFEKKPSPYSSIATRSPDGKRTSLFFFNGNGRGR